MPPGNRLQHPLVAEIERVDLDGTRDAGEFDDVFRTRKPGASQRYLDAVQVPAQVELGQWGQRNQREAGDAPDTRVTLVMHYDDLWRLDLVDSETREALFRKGDRLIRILERRTLRPAQGIRIAEGGLYATSVGPGGVGLDGRRNLLIVAFDERPRGLTGAAG
jgi:hypothetical protein